MSVPSWGAEAACFGLETDMFYPRDGKGGCQYPFLAEVRAICSGCSVRSECAEWAIKHESEGIWAGLTSSDRQAIRRKRNIVLDDPMYWGSPRSA